MSGKTQRHAATPLATSKATVATVAMMAKLEGYEL